MKYLINIIIELSYGTCKYVFRKCHRTPLDQSTLFMAHSFTVYTSSHPLDLNIVGSLHILRVPANYILFFNKALKLHL